MTKAASAAGSAPQSGLFAALRHRNYAIFWVGALISNTGTWLGNLTVPYVLFQATGSATWVGIAAVAQFGPVMILSPVGGLLADSVDRRKLLLWTQLTLFIVAALMWLQWLSGLHEPWLLVLLLTLAGAANGVNNPTWQSLVNDLVPRTEVYSAVTLNSLQFNLGRAIGPAVAGVLLASLGATWAFFFNALSFAGVLVALLFVRAYRSIKKPAKSLGFAVQWKQTLGYLSRSDILIACILLSCVVGFAANPIFNLTVVFAETVYQTDPLGFGVLAAALGVGAVLFVVGGLFTKMKSVNLARQLVIGLVVLAIGHALYAWIGTFAMGIVAGLMIGAAFLAVTSILNSLIQLTAPDTLRGKILAARHMVFSSSIGLGGFISGYLSDIWGVQWATFVLGVILLITSMVLIASKKMRGRFELNSSPERREP
ncbi:MFS transporter [Glutamicibacter uratoxydans]|uniref:MFS transporter n=1 Tax=Glutamicibacter uratoxydans TaxID=43667 RepID=UPI003D6DBEFC